MVVPSDDPHWSENQATPPQSLADSSGRTRSEDELRTAHARLAAELHDLQQLYAVTTRLVGDEGLDNLLEDVVHAAVALTHADRGTLQLIDEPTGRLRIAAHVGFEGPFQEFFEAVESHLAASWEAVLANRERVVVTDVQTSPIFASSDMRRLLHDAGVRALQSTPLISRTGRLVGVFSTHFRQPTQPDDDALGRLDLLARQTTDLIERSRAEEKLRIQSARLRLLWDAAAVLLRTDEPDAMLRDLFARIAPQFKLDVCFNYTVDDDGKSLKLQSCVGLTGPELDGLRRLEFGQGVCGAVAENGLPIVATHIQQSDDERVQFVRNLGIRAYVCNPMLADTRLLGTLSFGSRSRDEFSLDEIGFLQTICHYVAAAYERIGLVQRLRAADRRKDEFLVILAHELRNPLAPIRSGLDVLKIASDDPQTVAEVCEVMERQITQMARLIDDLMDVSRISRGKLTLEQVSVPLSEILSTAVAAARPQMEEAGHDLQVDLPGEELFLFVDPQRTVQILANLLWNAAKYTPPGGTIRVSTETLDGRRLAVKVRDSGIGIAREMQDSIFELFRQGSLPGGAGSAGLGIGLTLVKSLVEMHGGSISVASEGPGKGSEFRVELPLSPLPAGNWRSTPPQAAADPGRSTRHRILVVDDNTAALTTLRKSIELLGHDVQTADDGEKALRVAEEFRPELVFMDIGMPRADGYEAARRMRQSPWGRDVVLVALTGYGQAADKQRALDAGFDHHVTKPGEPGTVQALIAALDRSPHRYVDVSSSFPNQLAGGR